MKKYAYISAAFMTILSIPLVTFAHVTVKPSEVSVGQFQTFTVSVPVEKDVPTTGLRLVLPHGLKHVTPNVKPGWTITTTKAGESLKGEVLNTGSLAPEPDQVTEIVWSDGTIPAGQRDEFAFSAQVPTAATTIHWRAYQTYQDGTVVAWDQPPTDNHSDFANSGPYSETAIMNDVTNTLAPTAPVTSAKALHLSIVALALSLIAIGLHVRRK